MSDTLDWICNEIGVSKSLVLCKRQDKQVVAKRWTVMYFFHLLGKSTVWIGYLLNRDHSPVHHCIHHIKDTEKKRAMQAYEKYMITVEGKRIDEMMVKNLRPKIKIKIPNYHTGAVEEKEIFADEYKPKFTELQYNYKQGMWDK